MTYSKYLKPVDEWISLNEYVERAGVTRNSVYTKLSKMKRDDPKEYDRVRRLENGALMVNYGRLRGYWVVMVDKAREMYDHIMYDLGAFNNDFALARAIHEHHTRKDTILVDTVYRQLQYLYTDIGGAKRKGFMDFYEALYELHKRIKNGQ